MPFVKIHQMLIVSFQIQL